MLLQIGPSIAPPSWLVAWVALAASAISLAISLTTFVLTQRRPRVQLFPPNRVRVNATRDGTCIYIYMQPIWTNVGRSARAEVITPVLAVWPPHGSAKLLEYSDKSRTIWDAERREVHVEYVDDATPIIIPPNSIKSEMLTFKAPRQLQFTSGIYHCTISGDLATAKRKLAITFSFTITDEHRRVWLESDGRRYVTLTVDDPRPIKIYAKMVDTRHAG